MPLDLTGPERTPAPGLGTDEHLLALILVQIMGAAGNRPIGEQAWKLRSVGLTLAQIASVLDVSMADADAALVQWEATRPV